MNQEYELIPVTQLPPHPEGKIDDLSFVDITKYVSPGNYQSTKAPFSQVKSSIDGWKGYTIDWDDPAFSSGTNNVVITIESSEPANTIIVTTFKKQSLNFDGGSLSEVNMSIGYNGVYDSPADIRLSASPPRGVSESPTIESVSLGTIDVNFDFVGGVDTDLTQGSVDFWIKTVALPVI